MKTTEDAADPGPRDDPDRFLRFLIGSVPVLLAYIDTDRRYRFVNAAYAEWFGRSPEEIIGTRVEDLIGQAAYDGILPHLETALGGQTLTFEKQLPYAGIEPRFVHVTYVPDIGENGVVRGIVAVVTDINDRRRAEEQHRQAQAELALVIARARCLLWHADVQDDPETGLRWDARFVDAEAALRSFGVFPESGEDPAAAWYRSRLPEDRARDDANAAERIRKGENYSQEFRCRGDDGRVFWMKEDVGVETISPQRWHLVGVSTEITDRKTAEAERERMLLEADAAAVQQRAFLRDVLFSVTDGRLCLCAGADDLPPRLDNAQPPVSLTMYGGLRDLRRAAEQTAAAREFPKERRYDLITAASEAGMNAIIHAGGGTGEVRNDGRERVQVWISDTGAGIAVEQLPRATLARGYSTAATLGHGMKMMIQMVDRIFLLTGPDGTTVVLEQDRRAPSDGGLVF